MPRVPTLREAGVDDAELIIAVTSSDEVNLVYYQIIQALFRTPSHSRVRNSEYLDPEFGARFSKHLEPGPPRLRQKSLVSGYKNVVQKPKSPISND